MTKQEVIDQHPDEEFLFADGFNNCILGIDAVSNRVIYSIEMCRNTLVTECGMTSEDALEYLYFNSINAWVGDNTPIWCEV